MSPSRMQRRELEKEQERLARQEGIKNRFRNWKEERELKKQGYTNKTRTEYVGKHRKIDRILNRVILILLLMNIIVWLVVFFI